MDFETVDSHVHIFPKKQAKVVYDWVRDFGFEMKEIYEPSRLVRCIEQSGIDKAFLLNFAHRPGMAKEINDWTHSLSQKHDMLIPFGTVHPEDADVREEARRIFELGFKGLKLHPPAQRFHPLSEDLYGTYELLSELEKPIIFHCGFFEESGYHPKSKPEIYEEIAQSFPDLKICLAHICHKFTEEIASGKLEMLEEYENIYFDTAHWFSNSFKEVFNPPFDFTDLLKALKNYPKRFLFATDFPFTGFEIEEQVKNLYDLDIDEKILRDLAGKNAKRIIGIS